ncbi:MULTISPECIES: hypothetical protein [Lactobacillus]|jgi:hypothetical protein|uniref:hypothetical protein n=1 Tax=Lactobacillus TaxID=1578 RepID=UPI0021A3C577|nr:MULTISPECIES: hypothetical protein [Lactobacillus]MCT3541307.1 hypothetical protein [Lactobacillus crispatus]MCT3595199.1 hypothetical protein [Lactobacillus amylovorus]MDB6240226.1 hypothetical protein [Lactobacillus amylovorus]
MKKRFEVRLKDTSVKKTQISLIVDAFILLGFTILGLVGFLITFQAKTFNIMVILGLVAIGAKEFLVHYDFEGHSLIKKKIKKVTMSADLLRLRNTNSTSLFFDTREVIDAPRIWVTETSRYLQVEFYANGCPNPDNIYRLQKRLTEEFGVPTELIDEYDHATYWIRKGKQTGRKLNNDDFR